MTKSKPSLRNSAKCGLLLNILVIAFLFSGCSSSTAPTYLRKDITQAIQDICKKEYKIEVKAKLVGETIWLYLPVEDMFTALDKKDKPEKYLERFEVKEGNNKFEDGVFKLEYLIKVIPEQEKSQEYKYNKEILEKMNNIIMVLRRVLFSMDRSKSTEPKFLCIIAADIKNGFQMQEIFYYLDLKKLSYGFISIGEYQHRTIQEINLVPEAIGDKEGQYLKYRNIPLGEFIVHQIEHRIKLKFQKPEVDKHADIDKEIIKTVVNTLKIYNFRDFSIVEFNNLLTQNRIILNRQAIWARPTE